MRPLVGGVVGVVDLQAEQSGVGHGGDRGVADDPAPLGGQAVGEHRHAAGGPDQRDALADVGVGLGHVVRAAVVQQRGERVVDRVDDAGLDQRAGDVRPADDAAVAERSTICSQRHRVAVGRQRGDDPLPAVEPLVAQPRPLGGEPGVAAGRTGRPAGAR